MEIIAHRGLTVGPKLKTKNPLHEAVALGFGIEFDVRDSPEGLIMAHDPWEKDSMLLKTFLQRIPDRGTLAVNIKSCGLAPAIKEVLELVGVKESRCFFFDMSVPDHLQFLKHKLPSYARLSEFETSGDLVSLSAGVWLDAFRTRWWDEYLIKDLLEKGLKVCVVSPDLHRRDHQACWEYLKNCGLYRHPQVSLCTDYAIAAKDYFL